MAVEISPELQTQLDHLKVLVDEGGLSAFVSQRATEELCAKFNANEETQKFLIVQTYEWFLDTLAGLDTLIQEYQIPVSHDSLDTLLRAKVLIDNRGSPDSRYGVLVKTGTFTQAQVWRRDRFVELMSLIGVSVTPPITPQPQPLP